MENELIEYGIFIDENGNVEWPENESFVDYDARRFRVGDRVCVCGERYAIEAVNCLTQNRRNILVRRFN